MKDHGLKSQCLTVCIVMVLMASLITKDKKLFIGTYNGLSIYNGINVKSYNYKDGLPNGFITDLHEDINGNIWISFARKDW